MRSPYAFDIETCPLPLESFTARQRRRYDAELKRELKAGGVTTRVPDASSKVRGLHAWLGWVCCVAVAWREPGALNVYETRSFATETPDGEADMLAEFWAFVADADPRLVVSFNGKHFDSPYLRTRSLAHALRLPPVAARFLSTHRWRNAPHTDLAHLFHPQRVGLADVCELLHVETPKGDISGADVAGCVERGEIDRVARYCEADTRATLECYDVFAHLAAPVLS